MRLNGVLNGGPVVGVFAERNEQVGCCARKMCGKSVRVGCVSQRLLQGVPACRATLMSYNAFLNIHSFQSSSHTTCCSLDVGQPVSSADVSSTSSSNNTSRSSRSDAAAAVCIIASQPGWCE